MTRLALVMLLVVAVLTASPPAFAGCSWSNGGQSVNGMIQVHASYECDESGDHSSSIAHGGQPAPRDSGWDSVCVRTAIAIDRSPAEYCDLPVEALPEVVELTGGMVAAAFRRIPLPGARLAVQPPNGRTLVNFDTNFYTEQGELSRTVTLLGRQVELRIWPASFTWRFGDGASRQTTSPGSAYPHLEITHQYQRKGRVAPSVDTTYAAQFRVDGGAWRDVNGTVTIPGSPQSLRVVTARPVLVGG